jgi:hypothetical protein
MDSNRSHKIRMNKIMAFANPIGISAEPSLGERAGLDVSAQWQAQGLRLHSIEPRDLTAEARVISNSTVMNCCDNANALGILVQRSGA